MACLNGASGVDNQMNGRKATKALGLHQRNVIAANFWLQHEAEEGSFPLDSCHRQMHRASTITSEIKETVFQFWSVETRISPNKKDVVRKRIGKSVHVLHPVHLLNLPQVYQLKFLESVLQCFTMCYLGALLHACNIFKMLYGARRCLPLSFMCMVVHVST